MGRAGKAALLSALVFPGVGQLYLRRFARGALLLLAAAIPLCFIVAIALRIANDLADRLASGEIAPDLITLVQMALDAVHQASQSMNGAALVFIALWAVGVVDAYRLGNREPAEQPASSGGAPEGGND